jgi:hypothetical protein
MNINSSKDNLTQITNVFIIQRMLYLAHLQIESGVNYIQNIK